VTSISGCEVVSEKYYALGSALDDINVRCDIVIFVCGGNNWQRKVGSMREGVG